jgi:NAD-dependent deacetylase
VPSDLLISQAAAVAAALRAARHPLVLTGAGLSVPSGIPDFRSASGLWTRYDIEEYATIEAFLRHPEKVWRMFRELGQLVDGAAPNPGHVALAQLEQMGRLAAVVTQNIDGLHQRAGSRNVIEFHGTADRFRCVFCARVVPRAEAGPLLRTDGIPVCPCGRLMKPDVVLFGESIPRAALREAVAQAEAADVILVAGTSATVAPASLLPEMVRRHRGLIIEANQEETLLSELADLRLDGDVAETLPLVMSLLAPPG